MDTKLTLRLDKEIIEKIKKYAVKNRLSVSALTENLYRQILIEKKKNEDSISTPIARKYQGILGSDANNLDSVRYDYLKKKHVR
jgi:hypothetical protein